MQQLQGKGGVHFPRDPREPEEEHDEDTSHSEGIYDHQADFTSADEEEGYEYYEEEDGPVRPLAMHSLAYATEEENIPCSWSEYDASNFNIRQVGYKVTKEKAPSAPALYDCIGMDLIRVEEKIPLICETVALPEPRPEDNIDLINASGLPRLFIVNIQLPLKQAGTFGAVDQGGASLVWYFSIKPETVAQALDDSKPKPAIDLLKRFVSEIDTNEAMRKRFKVIACALNFDELGYNSKLSQFNGKPIVLKRTLKFHRTKNCFEVTIQVHRFNVFLRGLYHQLKDMSTQLRIRGGFLIQAEDDATELPEVILGCSALHNLDFEAATPLSALESVPLRKRKSNRSYLGKHLSGPSPIKTVVSEPALPRADSSIQETHSSKNPKHENQNNNHIDDDDEEEDTQEEDSTSRVAIVWEAVTSFSRTLSATFWGSGDDTTAHPATVSAAASSVHNDCYSNKIQNDASSSYDNKHNSTTQN